jgi:hypothetical protein
MATNAAEVEQGFAVFDINAACRRTSNPVTEVCDDILDRLQEVVILGVSGPEPQETRLCVHEAVQDMVNYADETERRDASLNPIFGGFALSLVNMKDETRTHIDKWGDDPYHNGMGETILAGIYGSDYRVDSGSDSHKRCFLIRGGGEVVRFPRIRHNGDKYSQTP